jgi:hypothetical protein
MRHRPAIAVLVSLVCVTCGRRNLALGQPYAFTKIADTSGPFRAFGEPDINSAGAVVFRAELDDGRAGIFLASGGVITTLADTSGPIRSFSEASINSLGEVAFWALHDDGAEAIYATVQGALTPIATTSGSGPDFTTFDFPGDEVRGTRPSINDSGTVAFWAELQTGMASGIFIGSGSPTTEILKTGGDYLNLTIPTINNAGDLAFGGRRSTDGTNVILKTSVGGSPLEIASAPGPSPKFGVPVINDDGAAIFLQVLDAGQRGLFTADGGSVATVADNIGPYTTFFRLHHQRRRRGRI